MTYDNTMVERAVEAARISDREAFSTAIRELAAHGWDSVQQVIAEAFVAAVEARLGEYPSVNDIVLLAQDVYPRSREFMNASVYDLEFLVRGYSGADLIAELIPRDAALAMELAMLGVLRDQSPVSMDRVAHDRL